MKPYVIEQGRMRSGWFFAPVFSIKTVTFDYRFDASCLYNGLEYDQTNKVAGICGLSVRGLLWCLWNRKAPHHYDSVRVSWACETDAPGIRCYTYKYERGVRTYWPTEFTYPNQVLTATVSLRKKFLFGYKLFSYFGGKKPAPHRMVIWLGWR